eukprot:TRINITY_DN123_c0_g1_i6.p1 TRINITY_DN123_c0_g1~~TRINITY_DN123_c0_g1_i6.p1  ORF type:complete len:364 (+),score=99.90 TRINITY_DN123_c0_g1_i6:69-1094(+)
MAAAAEPAGLLQPAGAALRARSAGRSAAPAEEPPQGAAGPGAAAPPSPRPIRRSCADAMQCWIRPCDRVEQAILGKPERYGNVKLYCGRRLQLPPTSSFVIFPVLLFVPPYAVADPILAEWPWAWYAARSCAWLSAVLILVVQLMDPGILPRQPPAEPRPDLTDQVNGVKIKTKWCTVCNMYPPPRAGHCRTCDVCITEMDHHCRLTGSCIGKRNLIPWLAWVAVTAAAAAFAFCGCVYAAYRWADFWSWRTLRWERFRVLLTVAWIFVWGGVLASLFALSMILMWFGSTQREVFVDHLNVFNHPYDHGHPFRNCYALCCKDIPPSVFAREPQPEAGGGLP